MGVRGNEFAVVFPQFVILAKAGIQQAFEIICNYFQLKLQFLEKIITKPFVFSGFLWIPAFAGMTPGVGFAIFPLTLVRLRT